jgi:hypothetical protein
MWRVWEKFVQLVPALKNVSCEIQEFGTATWEQTAHGQPARSEPGALGAAQMMQMTFRLRQAGANRLWHWSPLDTEIRDVKGRLRSLPTGQAWVYLVLEQMAGGETFLFPIATRGDGVKRLAAGSLKGDSWILMASAYHPAAVTMRGVSHELCSFHPCTTKVSVKKNRLFDDLPLLRDRPELAFRALDWANCCP